MAESFVVETREARETRDITEEVRRVVKASGVRGGLCHVMVLHATAAVVVNENDDPNIGVDLVDALERLVPRGGGWIHDRVDGNADSHIQAAILGPSEIVPIDEGDLQLGTWQGIMLVELDGPRRRKLVVRIVEA